MDQSRKNKSVTHEREVIVPLDPAHEKKPALVERERIEREQAEKEENKLIQHEEDKSGKERGVGLPHTHNISSHSLCASDRMFHVWNQTAISNLVGFLNNPPGARRF